MATMSQMLNLAEAAKIDYRCRCCNSPVDSDGLTELESDLEICDEKECREKRIESLLALERRVKGGDAAFELLKQNFACRLLDLSQLCVNEAENVKASQRA